MAKARTVASLPRLRTKEQEGRLISSMYDRSTRLLLQLTESGVSHPGLGFVGAWGLFDLMHGGAYAVPANQLPYFANDPSTSPYYAGEMQNVKEGGIFDIFSKLFGGGPDAADLWTEIMMDANVPHVLPKLISDEAYGLMAQTYVKFTAGELFGLVGTGLSTWVGAANSVLGRGAAAPKGGSNATRQAARAALARSDAAAKKVGG